MGHDVRDIFGSPFFLVGIIMELGGIVPLVYFVHRIPIYMFFASVVVIVQAVGGVFILQSVLVHAPHKMQEDIHAFDG